MEKIEPDAYCVTREDGECISTDPRCMHNKPVSKIEPVYAFRRKGLDDFCTCTKERYEELSAKPNLFEMATFFTSDQLQQVVVEANRIIAAQVAEIAALDYRLGNCDNMLCKEWEEHQETKAELEELKKDAERYRFIREQFFDDICPWSSDLDKVETPEGIDAAIDAERSGE